MFTRRQKNVLKTKGEDGIVLVVVTCSLVFLGFLGHFYFPSVESQLAFFTAFQILAYKLFPKTMLSTTREAESALSIYPEIFTFQI